MPTTRNSHKRDEEREKIRAAEAALYGQQCQSLVASTASIPITSPDDTVGQLPVFSGEAVSVCHTASMPLRPPRVRLQYTQDDRGYVWAGFIDPETPTLSKNEKQHICRLIGHALDTVCTAAYLRKKGELPGGQRSLDDIVRQTIRSVCGRYMGPNGYTLEERNNTRSEFWVRRDNLKTAIGCPHPPKSRLTGLTVSDRDSWSQNGASGLDELDKRMSHARDYLVQRFTGERLDWEEKDIELAESVVSLFGIPANFDLLNVAQHHRDELATLEKTVQAWCPDEDVESNRCHSEEA